MSKLMVLLEGPCMVKLGERKIIEMFLEVFGKPSKNILPFGDDVSGFDLGGGRIAVLKVDMFVDKTDMPPGMNYFQVGWKAITMSVSDFAAKAVKPQTVLVGLGLPSKLGKKEIEQIALGLKKASKNYGLKILGGDTNESENLTITSVIFGLTQKKNLILRSGAKPGDLLAVSGRFGKTSAGLKILLEDMDAPSNLKEKLLKPVYMPKAKLDLGLKLKKLGATSTIDSSDGLAWSLHELAKASNVGFIIEKLPIAKEAKIFSKIHELDPFNLTFYGGEEFEIVGTFNPKKFFKADKSLRKKFLVIGKVVKEKKIVYVKNGFERVVEPKGWEHFV
ncbi:thiamine-phosphate kinase [Candidatus Bathyarchaeota archaeon]|nr:MAG: thiamine-phosphate kinase [Candidatus Bathyarchaeota archaeon]